MKYFQFIMGPAGTGKSTYCENMIDHALTMKRKIHIINLDPAVVYVPYQISIDIRDLISLEDVVEEMEFGPNGGLVFCMEFLNSNLLWLEEQISEFDDDSYFLVDCPGQIELYTHFSMMRTLIHQFQTWGHRMCGVYLMDATFTTDTAKFLSGAMVALSTMVQLELPHINVLSKCDLMSRSDYEAFLNPQATHLVRSLNEQVGIKFKSLNEAMSQLIDDFQVVQFLPLDISDEDSLKIIFDTIDMVMQYGEDLEPKDLTDYEPEGES